MMNLAYLTRQLTLAADCIRRGLDILATEPDAAEPSPDRLGDRCTRPPAGWTCSRAAGHEGPCAAEPTPGAPPAGGPDPLARSMTLAMTIQKQVEHGKVLVALTERLDTLTKVLLDVAPDACARHDLFAI